MAEIINYSAEELLNDPALMQEFVNSVVDFSNEPISEADIPVGVEYELDTRRGTEGDADSDFIVDLTGGTTTTSVSVRPGTGISFNYDTDNNLLTINTGNEDGSFVVVNTDTGEITDGTNTFQYLYRYLHVRFSANSDGSGFVTNPDSVTGTSIYIGLNNRADTTAPSDNTAYNWTEFVWSASHNVFYRKTGGNRIEFLTSTQSSIANAVLFANGDSPLDFNVLEINTDNIVDGAVAEAKVATNAVTTSKIMDSAVETMKIAVGAVDTDRVATAAIVTQKIAVGAVDTDRIAANSVVAEKISANAVTADKINANAVTADKINANAVTTDKLDVNAVTADKIMVNAITVDKINAGAVVADKIEVNAVTTEKINAGAVETDKIADTAVTSTKAMLGDGLMGSGTNAIMVRTDSNTTTIDSSGNVVVNRGLILDSTAFGDSATNHAAGAVPNWVTFNPLHTTDADRDSVLVMSMYLTTYADIVDTDSVRAIIPEIQLTTDGGSTWTDDSSFAGANLSTHRIVLNFSGFGPPQIIYPTIPVLGTITLSAGTTLGMRVRFNATSDGNGTDSTDLIQQTIASGLVLEELRAT